MMQLSLGGRNDKETLKGRESSEQNDVVLANTMTKLRLDVTVLEHSKHLVYIILSFLQQTCAVCE